MTFVKYHIEDCETYLGGPFTEVHLWLDEYAQIFNVGYFLDYHRTFRHNTYGLRCIYGMWGPKAEKAGRLHLIRDYLESPITNDKTLHHYIEGNGFNKMMMKFDNPADIKHTFHPNVIDGWIKEGFGLVCLATRELVEI